MQEKTKSTGTQASPLIPRKAESSLTLLTTPGTSATSGLTTTGSSSNSKRGGIERDVEQLTRDHKAGTISTQEFESEYALILTKLAQ